MKGSKFLRGTFQERTQICVARSNSAGRDTTDARMEAVYDAATHVAAPKSWWRSHLEEQIGGPFYIVQPRRLARVDSSQCDL